MNNPYKNRNLPVGKLEYFLPHKDQKKVNSIDAMLEYGEKELLYDIGRKLGGGNIANLGCSTGGSATLLASGLKAAKNSLTDSKVYTIDIYPKNNLNKAKEKFIKHDVRDIIQICHGTTAEYVNYFISRDIKFSFVFIDADHSYEGVRDDFKSYSQLLFSDALIAFHDTNQEYTDKVINKYLKDWKMIEWINRIKVFQK